jgi:prepilin peptidase CpaA
MHQTANQILWAITLAFTFCAGWIDGQTSRIPNWLTVPGFIAGVAVHTYLNGWHGTLEALEGAALALAILLPFVLLRALGAGDWKLMGAVGALLGPWMLLFVLLASFFIAGAMAVALMIYAKRMRETLQNMGSIIRGFFAFGLRAHPEISLDNPGLLKLPFGVAAAIGTLTCFVAAHWVLVK